MSKILIKVIPAPHDKEYSEKVSEFLLEEKCQNLCLEFPREAEKHFNRYAKGEISYGGMSRILLGGGMMSSIFEEGYQPLFHILPKLKGRNENFRIYCYEEFEVFDSWVFARDELILQLLTTDKFECIHDCYENLVRQTSKRNEIIVKNISEIASGLGSDLYVAIGRLHAPLVIKGLKENFRVDEVVLEDLFMTPLDESIIMRLKGNELECEEQEYLQKHRELAKEAGRRNKGLMALLRDPEIGKKYDLTKYSYLK